MSAFADAWNRICTLNAGISALWKLPEVGLMHWMSAPTCSQDVTASLQ
jgi:hypothetical protein